MRQVHKITIFLYQSNLFSNRFMHKCMLVFAFPYTFTMKWPLSRTPEASCRLQTQRIGLFSPSCSLPCQKPSWKHPAAVKDVPQVLCMTHKRNHITYGIQFSIVVATRAYVTVSLYGGVKADLMTPNLYLFLS